MLKNGVVRLCRDCLVGWEIDKRRKDKQRVRFDAAYEEIARKGEFCHICGFVPDTRRLNVDHSHKTGLIRGILCYRCNYGLRWFSDQPDRLRKAASYLEQPSYPTL